MEARTVDVRQEEQHVHDLRALESLHLYTGDGPVVDRRLAGKREEKEERKVHDASEEKPTTF
jgi:hypothetical protein